MTRKMHESTALIVDDEFFPRKALLDGVPWTKLGINHVFEAASAEEARKVIKEQKVDLCLIDIEMPRENGLSLLHWIREEYNSDIPCAFLTCHASFPYAQEAMRLRCQDYLLKPIDYEQVENLLLRMLKEKRSGENDRQILQYGKQYLHEWEEDAKSKEKVPNNTAEIVDHVKIYIDDHISEKLSLNALAADVGLNPDYLSRLFREKTGLTVNKYIIHARMMLAANLLKQNVRSYAVAETVGYDNYANFVNMFKKTYGVSPNVWQKQEETDR